MLHHPVQSPPRLEHRSSRSRIWLPALAVASQKWHKTGWNHASGSHHLIYPLPPPRAPAPCPQPGRRGRSWAGGISGWTPGCLEGRGRFCRDDHSNPFCAVSAESFQIFPLLKLEGFVLLSFGVLLASAFLVPLGGSLGSR